jgi:Spy/CpxP family protein refolding chaperone
LVSNTQAESNPPLRDNDLRQPDPIHLLALSEKQKKQLEQLHQEMGPAQSKPIKPQQTIVDNNEEVDLEFLLTVHANKNQEKNQRDEQAIKHRIAMQVKLQNILTPEQLEQLDRLHQESANSPRDA